jgi:hypothetical protein
VWQGLLHLTFNIPISLKAWQDYLADVLSNASPWVSVGLDSLSRQATVMPGDVTELGCAAVNGSFCTQNATELLGSAVDGVDIQEVLTTGCIAVIPPS